LGYPNLPVENTAANYASIVLLLARNNQPKWAQHLISHIASEAGRYDFPMAEVFENHPLEVAFQQF